jgi:hypothetical protein
MKYIEKKNMSGKIKRTHKTDTYFAPMQSMVQINGTSSCPSPAIIGWQKYGPNLECFINTKG